MPVNSWIPTERRWWIFGFNKDDHACRDPKEVLRHGAWSISAVSVKCKVNEGKVSKLSPILGIIRMRLRAQKQE